VPVDWFAEQLDFMLSWKNEKLVPDYYDQSALTARKPVSGNRWRPRSGRQ
jgi:hypothetical protein